MIEFIKLHQSDQLKNLGQKAKEKAEKLFLIKNIIKNYESIIDEIVK